MTLKYNNTILFIQDSEKTMRWYATDFDVTLPSMYMVLRVLRTKVGQRTLEALAHAVSGYLRRMCTVYSLAFATHY